jgi:2-amino-4-hydroxy-6-hydroxymethyldihydropteridine diphosphokinase
MNIFLCLSTNLGDRATNLQHAVASMQSDVQVISASKVYETPPWGYVDQPMFLNQVLQVQTNLPPFDLLTHLKKTEHQMGRVETFRNGPRLIDIDILFYGDMVVNAPQLTLPHPRLHQRAFVLVPLADLAPNLVHPVIGKTVQQMLQAVDRSGIIPYLPPPTQA